MLNGFNRNTIRLSRRSFFFVLAWSFDPVRQNFSRGPKRGGSGGAGVNTIINSVQQGDPKRASPVRVERAYIRIYKGSAESRSELCSIVTMLQATREGLNLAWRTV